MFDVFVPLAYLFPYLLLLAAMVAQPALVIPGGDD
jgi:hypothetical protein